MNVFTHLIDNYQIYIEGLVVLSCLIMGTRYGGMGLGLISGIGLVIFVFIFHLTPGKPPIDVMLTILAVIGCAAVLQTAGGLDVMMQAAERLLRKHPQHITLLAPLTTWGLTFLCGTGHVVYTMFPIINDIAIKRNIRPERPMAVASVASQMGIVASPVSVAVVTLVAILSVPNLATKFTMIDILKVSIPASLIGVIFAALWSMKRGKDLDKDEEFQERIKDPVERAYIYGNSDTLLTKTFSPQAYYSVWLFLLAIAAVVMLGAFPALKPTFMVGGKSESLSMNLVIQMMMLTAGALILLSCKVKASEIANGAVFKAGMVAVFSVFGVAWMSQTFFNAHLDELKLLLSGVVQKYPWTYAMVLFMVSKLVNSQAAALTAIAPLGLSLGVDPKMLIAFFTAAYGYFILPTYPSDLACIGFDRSGTTKIGKYIINHSFIIPGLIGVFTSCVAGYFLSVILL